MEEQAQKKKKDHPSLPISSPSQHRSGPGTAGCRAAWGKKRPTDPPAACCWGEMLRDPSPPGANPTCPPAPSASPPCHSAWGHTGAGNGAPSSSRPPGRAAKAHRPHHRAPATAAHGGSVVVLSASAASPRPGEEDGRRMQGEARREDHGEGEVMPPTCPL